MMVIKVPVAYIYSVIIPPGHKNKNIYYLLPDWWCNMICEQVWHVGHGCHSP